MALPAAPPAPAAQTAQPASDTRAEALRAYQAALDSRTLAATVPLSTHRLQTELSAIEDKILAGRRDEAIGDLVYLIESPRFDPFAKSEEGRAALARTNWRIVPGDVASLSLGSVAPNAVGEPLFVIET